MFNSHDLRLWIINSLLISITFADIELGLKILSLLLAIGYTTRRWYLMEKNKIDKDETK